MVVFHVIHRPVHTESSNSNNTGIHSQYFMPRYHYSKVTSSNSPTGSLLLDDRNGFLSNGNNTNTMTSTKSFIPLVTNKIFPKINNSNSTSLKSEYIQIPVIREETKDKQPSTTTTNTTSSIERTTPITYYVSETNIPTNNYSKTLTNPLRSQNWRTSKYFQYDNNNNNNVKDESITKLTDENKFPLITAKPPLATNRRLNLSDAFNGTLNETDSTTSPNSNDNHYQIPVSNVRVNIPVTLDHNSSANNSNNSSTDTTHLASSKQVPLRPPNITIPVSPLIPSSSISRISSAISKTPNSPLLTRQKNDSERTTLFPWIDTPPVIVPRRTERAEVMAREAIQGINRFQSSRSSLDNTRSPALSRRVIINLKNNQSVVLDSRLSSATAQNARAHNRSPVNKQQRFTRLPSDSEQNEDIKTENQSTTTNNLFHIPVLHEIQISSSDNEIRRPFSAAQMNYKNEFRLELPVTILNTQENSTSNGVNDPNGGDENILINVDQRFRSPRRSLNNCFNDICLPGPSTTTTSSYQLKSILKRSSSRDAISRKSVSFMT
ncbi:unnamed protein product [Didymodactylos carnosus]|uniref:Uncharacterized protein n=1 Tax=Didymodactylos carnosus TaxID=1234261 RepID=A0A8S2CYH6_9BILA|nr:unnamed protein product [Didymodactylos carnosus]CAF3551766.1 unnamed protein product [Didymodactylos carnosus]